MNIALLLAYFTATLLLLLTPGPVVALVTGTALAQGPRRAFATAIGTNMASLVLIALAALTLAGVVALEGRWLAVLGTVGSLYIGSMAWSALRSAPDDTGLQPGLRGGWLRGFLTAIANPKDILFFAAFFPQFIAITPDLTRSLIWLTLVWLVVDLGILSLLILLVRRWLPGRRSPLLARISALFLLLIAVAGVIYNLRELI
ncbi:LysE family translocator [Candidatus Pantoea multigeneris]|uniref:LysE family translocator n=1 Tax=Candidatus Pantoea multigeneris TaxID=2608357 RepID=A0ABX0RG47_9GAMM|nr:LysE family translocator [Pantoea multigeneris]NIF22225.1 LysE family translocator [Pantoea multigeneris]